MPSGILQFVLSDWKKI